MFAYDLKLAVQSLRRNPGLTLLMVLAVGLGIAVCTVTFTVYHAMATNPVPERSDRLHAVTMDTWSAERPYDDEHPEHAPMLMTYRDATFLHEAQAAPRTVTLRAIAPQGLLVDERGQAQTVSAAGGVYRLSLPGATCRDAVPCRIGGAPRLLVEQGAAAGRAALTVASAPLPALPVPTASPPASQLTQDRPWRPGRPGYLWRQ